MELREQINARLMTAYGRGLQKLPCNTIKIADELIKSVNLVRLDERQELPNWLMAGQESYANEEMVVRLKEAGFRRIKL